MSYIPPPYLFSSVYTFIKSVTCFVITEGCWDWARCSDWTCSSWGRTRSLPNWTCSFLLGERCWNWFGLCRKLCRKSCDRGVSRGIHCWLWTGGNGFSFKMSFRFWERCRSWNCTSNALSGRSQRGGCRSLVVGFHLEFNVPAFIWCFTSSGVQSWYSFCCRSW